jgi:VanZ family protein
MRGFYYFLRRKAVWWTLFVVWLAAVFYASSLTGGEVSPYVPTFLLHKLAHVVAYSSGAVILGLSLRSSTRWGWMKIAVVSVVAVSVYGATDEWHQAFTPGRGPAFRDWLIDTGSGMAGVGVLLWVRRRVKRWVALLLVSSGKP